MGWFCELIPIAIKYFGTSMNDCNKPLIYILPPIFQRTNAQHKTADKVMIGILHLTLGAMTINIYA